MSELPEDWHRPEVATKTHEEYAKSVWKRNLSWLLDDLKIYQAEHELLIKLREAHEPGSEGYGDYTKTLLLLEQNQDKVRVKIEAIRRSYDVSY